MDFLHPSLWAAGASSNPGNVHLFDVIDILTTFVNISQSYIIESTLRDQRLYSPDLT